MTDEQQRGLETGDEPVTRREAMLKLLRAGAVAAGVAGTGVWLSTRSVKPEPAQAEQARRDHRVAATGALPHMAVAQYAVGPGSMAVAGEPRALVARVLDDMGGIGHFIRPRDVVVVKPNIAWDRTPEQAANTNPEVVAELVRQALAAGARKVIVTDVSCNEAQRCFHRSGIAAAATAAGAEVVLPSLDNFREVDLGGAVLKSWPVFKPFLRADKVINAPIAKHHGLTGATLGMKNWYGILGGERNRLHQQIHQSLVDLANFMLPTLTVMDCYRVLVRNGPTGGNLEDVELHKTVVASIDPVAVDAWVAKAYWGLEPEAMAYLGMAERNGLGTVDYASLGVKTSLLA